MVNQRGGNGQGDSAQEARRQAEHRCGFVSVAGRPNVGKSTLVNRLVGQELCIVTPKAQTTRNRITAIHNLPNAQMILVDTPGIHDPATPLNRAMVSAATSALADADAVLFMVAPSREMPDEDRRIIGLLESAGTPTVLAINKIDLVPREELLPVIAAYSEAHRFREIVPICALTGEGMDTLAEALVRLLPLGPSLYPEDDLSDLPARFFVAELVREQVTFLTQQEIPYKTAVIVESFEERPGFALIRAEIHVERDSQKRIIIGKGGQMIKRIGIEARKKIEDFLGYPVRLELFVKVSPRWTRDPRKLDEFGYTVT